MERAMYAIRDVPDDADAFREAVAAGTAYKPLYAKIKLFFGCNLRCEMCNHWRGHTDRALPAARFFDVLDELAELGCRKVHFSGGEPLLRPQVPDLIERASCHGIRVTMTTNGTLVDKAGAKRMVEVGLRGVNVSIDSPDRRVHDRVRGVKGAWKLSTKSVRLFRRYAHKGKITIRINTVVSRLNYRSLVTMPELAAELGADVLNLIPVDDHCGEHLSLRRQDIQHYNAEIGPRVRDASLGLGLMSAERDAFPFGLTDDEVSRGRKGEYAMGWYEEHPCYAPWTQTLIDFNGKVYVCCMTREQIPALGDLGEQSFSDIWRSAAYDEIRQRMHPPELGPCRKCDDYLEENRALLQISLGRRRGPSPTRPTYSPA